MSQIINWDNTQGSKEIKVYRSTSRFTPGTLPTDFVILPGGSNQMEYMDAIRGILYYFMVESIDDDDNSFFSPLFNAAYLPDTGPGPDKIVSGDSECGYYGEVPAGDVITFQEIWSQVVRLGRAPLIPAPNNNPAVYHKFIFMGKIIYVPLQVFHTSINSLVGVNRYQAAYERYGFTTGWDVNQGILLSKGRYSYRWRMPCVKTDLNVQATVPTISMVEEQYNMSEMAFLIGVASNPQFLTTKAYKDMLGLTGPVLGKINDLTIPNFATMNSRTGEAVHSGTANYMWQVVNNTITTINWQPSNSNGGVQPVLPLIILEI